MFWDSKKSIERRRIISVRKSKTGFADAYVKFSLGGFDGGKGKRANQKLKPYLVLYSIVSTEILSNFHPSAILIL